jgi:hypothetical protein
LAHVKSQPGWTLFGEGVVWFTAVKFKNLLDPGSPLRFRLRPSIFAGQVDRDDGRGSFIFDPFRFAVIQKNAGWAPSADGRRLSCRPKIAIKAV